MTQSEITRVGNELITAASKLIAAGNSTKLQRFYDDLEWESEDRGGDKSMPLGWVAERILADAKAADVPMYDPMVV